MKVPSVPVVADVEMFCKSFRKVLSKPQYAHFYRLVISLLVCLQAHRVTDSVRLFQYCCHWTNVYKFLRSEAWYYWKVAQELWNLVIEQIGNPIRVFVVLDDTTVRHGGARKMEEVRQHHNASAQNDPCRPKKVWGHKWVLLGLAVMMDSLHWEFMPISAFLVEAGVSKLQLALSFFTQLNIPATIILTVIADGWYTKRPLVTGLFSLNMNYLGKVRKDAKLYEPLLQNPSRKRNKRGPRPQKGPRVYLTDLTKRQPELCMVDVIIRGKKRCVDIWSKIVIVPRWNGMQVKAMVVRWKLKSGRLKYLNLLCTDLTLPLLDILKYYDARWMIEPCFCYLKQVGGFASYSGRKIRGHLAWAHICCVARTLLVLLNLKSKKGGIIDPWRRRNQPEYPTVGQRRLELTSLFSRFASLEQKAPISGDSETIKCQRTKNR